MSGYRLRIGLALLLFSVVGPSRASALPFCTFSAGSAPCLQFGGAIGNRATIVFDGVNDVITTAHTGLLDLYSGIDPAGALVDPKNLVVRYEGGVNTVARLSFVLATTTPCATSHGFDDDPLRTLYFED